MRSEGVGTALLLSAFMLLGHRVYERTIQHGDGVPKMISSEVHPSLGIEMSQLAAKRDEYLRVQSYFGHYVVDSYLLLLPQNNPLLANCTDFAKPKFGFSLGDQENVSLYLYDPTNRIIITRLVTPSWGGESIKFATCDVSFETELASLRPAQLFTQEYLNAYLDLLDEIRDDLQDAARYFQA